MYNKKSSLIKHLDFFVLDTLSLVVSFFISYLIRSSSNDFVSSNSYLNILLWMLVPNLLFYILFNPYQDVIRRSKVDEIKLSLRHTIINFLFTVSILFISQTGIMYSRLILGYTYVLYFFLSFSIRIIWKLLVLNGVIKANAEEATGLFLISGKDEINQTISNINNSDYELHQIKGVYLVDDENLEMVNSYPVIKDKKNIHGYVVDNNINAVFITAHLNKAEQRIIKQLIEEGIEVQLFINSLFDIEAEDQEISNIGMYGTLQLNSFVFSSSQRVYFFFKRVIDVIVSLLGCLLLIPAYLFIKLSYLASGDKEPITYTHTRIGLDGKPFELYKFRSMIPDADDVLKEMLKDEKIKAEWEKNQKLDNDPRITKVGAFIRKTSIDELPQFINVLKGEMSVIGPRPLVPGELKNKNGIKLYERVKPGITGWWACNGRSEMSYEERLEHEYYYVRNCSLYLDLLCVIRTIYVVLFRKGAK